MSSLFTYNPTSFSSQISPKNTPVFYPASSGKEKDSETGYHYFGARYYNSDLSLWLSVDPMSDKYPNLSPYNYCLWNPLRVIDPDGRDGWDKIMGYGIGIITNIIPGSSGLRDSYAPTNTFDYNSSLQAADHVSVIAGGLMITAGAAGASAGTSMVAGGATVAATGIGAPEGAAIALSGATVDGISIATGLVGTSIVIQAMLNTSQGYDRGQNSAKTESGGTRVQSKTLWKSKGKDGAHIDVENPNPGNRKGGIHYQEKNKKYYYNKDKGYFEGAPDRVNKRLQTDKKMKQAIKNGMKYLEQ